METSVLSDINIMQFIPKSGDSVCSLNYANEIDEYCCGRRTLELSVSFERNTFVENDFLTIEETDYI